MNDSTLTKVWSAVALFALYSAFNGVADVQNSSFLLPFVIEINDERGPAAKAIFWFLLAAFPYWVTLYLARCHIRRNNKVSALSAWPVMFGLGLLTTDPLARRYQWFWLLLLLTIPVWSCGFLLNEIFELWVFKRKFEDEILAKGWIEHLTTFHFGHDYRVRSEEGGKPVSYYPGVQPVAFLLLLIAILYQWARVIWDLVAISKSRRNQTGTVKAT